MSRRFILLGCLTLGVSACKNLSGTNLASAKVPEAQDLDVPYITTPDNVVMTILNIAGVTAKDFVLDLGSGDGRIPITAAARFGAKGLGVEIDPNLVEASKVNAKLAQVEQLVDFKVQDLFETDLAQASVITMYLLPDVNLKLKPALQKLKPGTRIVSHDWDMGDWQPDRTEVVAAPDKKVGLNKQSKIMLWVVK
jgi:SAM-dependent methyltransferase